MFLSMGSASNLLASCLIGIPLRNSSPSQGGSPTHWTLGMSGWEFYPMHQRDSKNWSFWDPSKATYWVKFYYRPSGKAWPVSKYQKSLYLKTCHPTTKSITQLTAATIPATHHPFPFVIPECCTGVCSWSVGTVYGQESPPVCREVLVHLASLPSSPQTQHWFTTGRWRTNLPLKKENSLN